MDENQKRAWVLATLTEDIQDYVADRADALEREHSIDLGPDDRAVSLLNASKPARVDIAKAHARMVREAATHLRERELDQAARGDAERAMDYAFARHLVEAVAQAIEKGGR